MAGNDSGLAALGWLLVAAAVAGVAAAGVVLVGAVVGSSARSVGSHSARQEAAENFVEEVERRWRAQSPASEAEAERLNRLFGARCLRVGILYPLVALEPAVKAGVYAGAGGGWDAGGLPVCTLA